MRKLNYFSIALLPLMLAACGGNFGVQPVAKPTPTAQTPSDSKPSKPEDVPTPPPAKPSIETTPVNRPAVGAAMTVLYIIPENILPNLCRVRERCNIPATGNI